MHHLRGRLYRGPVGVVLQPFVRLVSGHGLARHKLVWWSHRLVWRLTRSHHVQVRGLDLETDYHDSLQLARGSYEADEIAWYESVVRPGDHVLELGGNIGYFACIYADLVGPEGSVTVYEPDPMIHAIAERNVAANGFADRVEIRRFAVSDTPGTADFYRAGRNYGNNSLFRFSGDALGGTSFPVDVVTIDDDLGDRTDRFDLVKMDIQGAEIGALRGMRRLLQDRPPVRMLIEFWPHGLAGMGEDPGALLDLLAAAGYTVREQGLTDPIDRDALLARLTPENRDWVNIDCTWGP